jgi:hypothetical protein
MYILEVLQSEPPRLATYQGVLFYVYTSVLIFGELLITQQAPPGRLLLRLSWWQDRH